MPGSITPDAVRQRLRLYLAPARCRGVGALKGRLLHAARAGASQPVFPCLRREEKPLDKVAKVNPEALQKEALAAVEAAATLVELDEARVKYLGRSSELKLALREVRDRE